MNNNYINLVISGVILLCASYIYDKFKINLDKNDNFDDLDLIRKHLLNKSNLQLVIRTHASIKKHVFYRLLDSTFTINVIYWYYKL